MLKKPMSQKLTDEEIQAADEMRQMLTIVPQAIVRWPKGLQNQAVIFPLGDSDKETAAIVRKLKPIESKEES